jgi:hypothetical protein
MLEFDLFKKMNWMFCSRVLLESMFGQEGLLLWCDASPSATNIQLIPQKQAFSNNSNQNIAAGKAVPEINQLSHTLISAYVLSYSLPWKPKPSRKCRKPSLATSPILSLRGLLFYVPKRKQGIWNESQAIEAASIASLDTQHFYPLLI